MRSRYPTRTGFSSNRSPARSLPTSRGTLADQINRRVPAEVRIPRLAPTRAHRPRAAAHRRLARRRFALFNGTGGFSPDGREYVIAPAAGDATPAPWVNVLANPHFGTVVSESGPGYTWSENAQLFRLTPWRNDSVSESSGEALYLRDEETGRFWSPTSSPCAGAAPYVTRHGFGYSVFEHMEDGIRSELTVFVALDAAVKFSSLKVSNHSGPDATAVRHGLRRVGTGRSASEIGDARDDRDRCRDWCVVCSKSVQQRIPGLGRVLRRRRTALEP